MTTEPGAPAGFDKLVLIGSEQNPPSIRRASYRRAMGRRLAMVPVMLIAGLSCDQTRENSQKSADTGTVPIGDRARVILAAKAESTMRLQDLAQLFDSAQPADLNELIQEFQAASPYLRPMDLEQLAVWWTVFAPKEAISTSLGSQTLQPDFWKVEVLRNWAARDPRKAHDAWKGGACPIGTDHCLLALVAGWVQSGDDGVWKFVEELPSEFARQTAMDVLAASLIANIGPGEAILFAESLTADGKNRFKLHFYRRLASALAMHDIETARAWAEKHGDGPYGDGLMRRVAVRWIARDAPAAMAWLITRSPGPQRDDAIRAACLRWIQGDRKAALDWISHATEIEPLQPGLAAFALARATDDPLQALAMVDQIADEGQREMILVNVMQTWLSRSPSDAEDWIKTSGIDQELEAKIRSGPTRHPPRKVTP